MNTHRESLTVQGFLSCPHPPHSSRLTHKITIFVSVCIIYSCLCHYKWNSIVYVVCLASFVKYHVTSTGFQKLRLTCEPSQGWDGFEKPWLVLVGSMHSSIGGVLAPQWNGPLMECRRPMGRASWNWKVRTEHPFFSWPWWSVPLPRALGESWCERDSIRIFDVVSNCLIFCSIANISVWLGKKFTNMWCEQKTFYRKHLLFVFITYFSCFVFCILTAIVFLNFYFN